VTAPSWRPLLEEELAARAEDAVRAIAEALSAPSTPGLTPGRIGHEGLALFYGYLSLTEAGAERHAQRADQLLEQAVANLANVPMRPALYGGFTGVAWVADHLATILGESTAEDDRNEEIDEILLALLAGPWIGDYDLISGLAGFGVYALDRFPRPSAVRCLEGIVDRLHETVETIGDASTWFTPPWLLPPRNLQTHPDGYYNLGVAHGVPGVIAFLADVCRLGIRTEKAGALLEGAVRWVLSHQLPGHRGSTFPTSVAPGIAPHPSRLAWCYGDPGIATTLLYAARALGHNEWERTALDIARHAATASPEDTAVVDAGLCHGALGLAHLYNRIYQAGGGDVFADAARLWYARGLDLRRPDAGVAGFASWEFGPDMEVGWQPDPGFLTGAAGIGLALLAGFTSVEPRWDRLLMVGVGPAKGRARGSPAPLGRDAVLLGRDVSSQKA
jgi:lantibiotic biosynthesis protein